MVADLVASYVIELNEGATLDDLRAEIADFLDMMKGIQRWNLLELQDGSIAFELHLHGQTEREVAKKAGERILKNLVRFDLGTVEYSGIEFPDDVQYAKEKWQGRENLDDILTEVGDKTYIRLDYYTRGLSFEDLGITDANAEMLYVQALQRWPQKIAGREAIRRVRDHFERLNELQTLGKITATPAPRGRTGQATSIKLDSGKDDPAKEETSVAAGSAA